MARDAEWLDRLARDREPAFVLRSHGWAGPTLTVGRVQTLDPELLAGAQAAGVEVARRPTGGGWLLHVPGDISLTYLVAGPLKSGGLRGAAADVAAAIEAGLGAAGRQGRVQSADGGAPGREDVCFSRTDREEVSDGGVKVAGVALVLRKRSALVQTAVPSVPARGACMEFARRWDPERERAVERLEGLDIDVFLGAAERALAARVSAGIGRCVT